ncbi:type VI secretion system baseplate subunit TssF [Pantoea sp. SS70]|uniref:type VI secretion system baseplate subunit TssF n=1 Tax=Pantoea sp. SS70 TaxID=3024247 RepID=UPI0024528B1F|nr:type VI secretion system baseplate subunit TssF [Pantoea sp. SS70]WGK60095.1 type VI secretion system baseplate subunit TssF [Pantoea sp. SS70]
MMKKLLSYYQKELTTLHQHGKAFAHLFPKVARRLGFSEGRTEDPHVERLIESFALLTAQIHQRLDDDMQQVTQGLMQTLAPQLLRTFPSACIVQFTPDRKASGMTAKKSLPAELILMSKPIEGQVCRFATLYPLTLWPATLTQADLALDSKESYWCLHLHFTVWPGATVADNRLRLHLHGSASNVNLFYALIASELKQLELIQGESHTELPLRHIGEVGFSDDEALFNRDARVAATHSLLHDYLLFTPKFHFIDLPLPANFVAAADTPFSIRMVFNRCAMTRQLDGRAGALKHDFFRLNCTPAVNLYSRRAEPININAHTAEYPVIADVREKLKAEIWSIDRVKIQRTSDNQTTSLNVYALLGLDEAGIDAQNGLFWQQLQRESVGEGRLSQQCLIAFADRRGDSLLPEGDVALLEVTCHNGSLPSRMLNGDPSGDFDVDLPLAGITINALTRPTEPHAPPGKSPSCWQLISQLSLNHVLLSGKQGCQVLKETLSLYDFTHNRAMERLVEMITSLEVLPVNTRLVSGDPHSLARGVEIILTFTPEAEAESEYFLFCRFLDRFLGLYAPVNSFSRLITQIGNDQSMRRVWPIRAGRLSWI